jgi:undecaprenyl diphosphate synthase
VTLHGHEADQPDVSRDKLPKHIAIIMDGNGRWAVQQSKPRFEGHRRGVEVVRNVTTECCRIRLEHLTLFCLSSENWKRPQEELDFLLQLLQLYLSNELPTMMENNIQLSIIGRRDRLPESVLRQIDDTLARTKENTGMRLCLAINYGGRGEIVDAVKSIAQDVCDAKLAIDAIDERSISNHLYTSGMPDPDLLIRTAGEMRLSNFLLWQISYSVIWVTKKCWPFFRIEDLHQAIR